MTSGGFVLETHLLNSGGLPVNLTGALLTYNGNWYEALASPPAGRTLACYTLNDSSCGGGGMIYASGKPFGIAPMADIFTTPASLAAGSSAFFHWVFTGPSFFYLPYLEAFPSNAPTSSVPSNQNPQPNGSSNPDQVFYHSSDFSGVLDYTVGGVSCTLSVGGNDGPTIAYDITPGQNISGNQNMSIDATINGDNSNVDSVYFYVYDSSGTLVYWYKPANASGPFCLFGSTDGVNCDTRQTWVDDWTGRRPDLGREVYRRHPGAQCRFGCPGRRAPEEYPHHVRFPDQHAQRPGHFDNRAPNQRRDH